MRPSSRPLYARLRTILGPVFVVVLLSIASVSATAAKGENRGKGNAKPTTIVFDAPYDLVRGVRTCGFGEDSCPSKTNASISTSGDFVLYAVSESPLETINFGGDAFAVFQIPLRHAARGEHSKLEWTVTIPMDFAQANVSTVGVPAEATVSAAFNVTSTNCGTACPSVAVTIRHAQAVVGKAVDAGPSLTVMNVTFAKPDGPKLPAAQYDFLVSVRARIFSAAAVPGPLEVGLAQAFADGRVDSVRMTIYP